MQRWGGVIGAGGSQNVPVDSLFAALGKVVGVLSIPAVIYADAFAKNGKKLRIRGDFSIRYNRRLQNTPFAAVFPVNDPPKVRWVGVCKVKGTDVKSFFPADPAFEGRFSLHYLYNEIFPDSVSDTVVIDTGYTYYLAADSGMVRYTLKAGTKIIDSIRGDDTLAHVLQNDSIVADTSRNRRRIVTGSGKEINEMETFFYVWQYANLDLDSVSMPLDSLMVLSPAGESVVRMLPSLDPKFTHARIWTSIYDMLLNDYNRPRAFAFRETNVHFRYTEGYRRAMAR
jgi:hypothetical protein